MTVNDYLAKRDAEWTRPVYEALGATVGSIQNLMPFDERQRGVRCDITYGTNSEFGFDYLRDNMAVSPGRHGPARPLLAIVDEVDSILIDEARTPLIISGEPESRGADVLRLRACRPHARGRAVPADVEDEREDAGRRLHV